MFYLVKLASGQAASRGFGTMVEYEQRRSGFERHQQRRKKDGTYGKDCHPYRPFVHAVFSRLQQFLQFQ
jgi:hypothetical protein